MTLLTPLFNPVAIRERVILALKSQIPGLHVMHQDQQGINTAVTIRDQWYYRKVYVNEHTYVTPETETGDSLVDQFVTAIMYTLEQQEAVDDGRIVFTWREMAAQTEAHAGMHSMSYYAMTYGIVRTSFKK